MILPLSLILNAKMRKRHHHLLHHPPSDEERHHHLLHHPSDDARPEQEAGIEDRALQNDDQGAEGTDQIEPHPEDIDNDVIGDNQQNDEVRNEIPNEELTMVSTTMELVKAIPT